MADLLEKVEGAQGLFGETLHRNNKKIRSDRADQIIEGTERTYRRVCEDIAFKMKDLERERNSMLDLSPTDAQSLVLVKDFDNHDFVQRDIDIGLELRKLQIKYEVAVARYELLFNKKFVA